MSGDHGNFLFSFLTQKVMALVMRGPGSPALPLAQERPSGGQDQWAMLRLQGSSAFLEPVPVQTVVSLWLRRMSLADKRDGLC